VRHRIRPARPPARERKEKGRKSESDADRCVRGRTTQEESRGEKGEKGVERISSSAIVAGLISYRRCKARNWGEERWSNDWLIEKGRGEGARTALLPRADPGRKRREKKKEERTRCLVALLHLCHLAERGRGERKKEKEGGRRTREATSVFDLVPILGPGEKKKGGVTGSCLS